MVARFYPAAVIAPIVAIGTILFWIFRRKHPISSRRPAIGCATGALLFLIFLMYCVDERRPCSLADLTVTIICIPLGIFTYVLRAFLLLFKFETTLDLQGKRAAVGVKLPLSLSRSKPSFIVSHITVDPPSVPLLTLHSSVPETPAAAPISPLAASSKPSGVMASPSAMVTTSMTVSSLSSSITGTTPPALTIGSRLRISTSSNTPIFQRTLSLEQQHQQSEAKLLRISESLSQAASPTAATSTGVAMTFGGTSHVPSVVASSTSAVPAVYYSWYTRHHYLTSNRWIVGVTSIFTSICVITWIATAVTEAEVCTTGHAAALIACIVFSVVQCIIVLLLARKLSHHSSDALGIKSELRLVAICVLVSAVVLFPIVVLIYKAGDLWPYVIMFVGVVVWMSSILYPLILMCRIRRRQRLVANDVQKYESITDFLHHEQCVRAYSTFVAAEFSSESLSFYLRCREFKTQRNQTTNSTPFEGDRVQYFSSPTPLSPTASLAPPLSPKGGKPRVSAAAKALREAYLINRSFVVIRSPFEVNISASTRKQIAIQLKQLTTAVASSSRHGSHGAAHTTTSPTGAAALTALSFANNSSESGPHRSAQTTRVNMLTPSDADMLLLSSILSIFDDAMDEVLKLMQQGSFHRFRASAAYKQLIIELQQQHDENDNDDDNDNNDDNQLAVAAVVAQHHRRSSS